jgi:hypothetical protein
MATAWLISAQPEPVGVLAEILVARRVEEEGEACSKLITAEETEMPRARSTAIQSERTRRRAPRAVTSPASWIAPPNSSNFWWSCRRPDAR